MNQVRVYIVRAVSGFKPIDFRTRPLPCIPLQDVGVMSPGAADAYLRGFNSQTMSHALAGQPTDWAVTVDAAVTLNLGDQVWRRSNPWTNCDDDASSFETNNIHEACRNLHTPTLRSVPRKQ